MNLNVVQIVKSVWNIRWSLILIHFKEVEKGGYWIALRPSVYIICWAENHPLHDNSKKPSSRRGTPRATSRHLLRCCGSISAIPFKRVWGAWQENWKCKDWGRGRGSEPKCIRGSGGLNQRYVRREEGPKWHFYIENRSKNLNYVRRQGGGSALKL